jgi:hypothetical protein
MNILLNNNDFNIENVFLMENKENIIMNGIFVKILYSSEYFIMNGIYIDFPIQHYERKNFTPLYISNIRHIQCSTQPFMEKNNVHNQKYNDKNVLFFDIEKNKELILQFSKLENSIIDFYMKSKNIKNKKMVNNINTQLKNGMIKYYNYKHLNGLHLCKFTDSISKKITDKCDSDCHFHIQNGMNKFYIKISGIWETPIEVGITYKIIYY